ncbi:MAG: ABC transporter permease [Lachnospiraceae bacterium]|nr:ABC transporter permease [Lachnospiraceae bacterium]
MTLSKLAIKNIRKSIKDYSIYFFTLVIGVIIFYVFNAIESQTIALSVSRRSYETIELMNQFLSTVSIFVAIVLGGLIIYASRFLIKRRNKEFGVYLTLGMSKRKMSVMLFFETLLIGAISLGIGLVLGVAVSQLMSVMVANSFEADMTRFTFVFSPKAAVKSCIYFGIMYVVVIIFNTISVGKCKLIDLLHGDKKSERMSLKNPVLCAVIFLIAAAILGFAYYRMIHILKMNNVNQVGFVLLMGAVSTFFIFWSLSGMMLTLFRGMKGVFFKKLNSFTLRQFSYKANTMVVSMTVICLMLLLTIVLLGTAFSLSRSLNGNIKNLLKTDVYLYKGIDVSTEATEEGAESEILADLAENGFGKENFSDIVDYYVYCEEGLTEKAYCGDYLEEIKKNYLFIRDENLLMLIKESDYNEIAKLLGQKEIDLEGEEYAIVGNFQPAIDVRNKLLSEKKSIIVNGHELSPKYDKCIVGMVSMIGTPSEEGVYIVPDDVLGEDMRVYERILANYREATDTEKAAMEEKLITILDALWDRDASITYKTREEIKDASTGLASMVTFISMYVGIIFLIASAAVLSLKELSESADNIKRYNVLRRIGTDEKMINGALFKQIGMFFIFPMLLACIHSVVGFKTASVILESMGAKQTVYSLMSTASVILVVYGGYFVLTYFTSKRIIKG